MAQNPAHYELDATQFEQAMAILRKEQQANIPSRWQRISYILLRICVYGIVASFLLVIISCLTSVPELLLIPTFVGTISACLMPIVLLLNIPLLRKLRYQIRLVRSLGLLKFFKAPWKAERRKKRLQNIMVLLMVLLGLLAITPCLILGIYGTVGMIIEGLKKEADRNLVLVYSAIFLVILLIGIALFLAFIFFHLIRRYKQRLEVVTRLQSSLAGYKDAAEHDEDKLIGIPSEEYHQIAGMERAQILFEREKNIRASFKEPKVSYYSVQKSRSMREALNQLDAAERLAVENQIDELTSEPEPKGVKSDPKTNIHRFRVAETDLEIAFKVDYDNRRVKILFLKHVADDTTSRSDSGGKENA
jgi:mRNA-degrading endonuclease RelE of RelBE toxin-antitoxin system